MDDRRRFRRIEADFKVEVFRAGEEEQGPIAGTLSDCSTGGLALRTEVDLAVGEEIRVRVVDMRLGSTVMELGLARVQRACDHTAQGVTKRRVGLQFLAPDTATVQQLLNAAQVRRKVRSRAQARRTPDKKKTWL